MDDPRALLNPLDRSAGNGSGSSSDDWLDDTSIYSNEWGSQAATTFNPREIEGGTRSMQERYQRLYELQNGKGEPSRKGTIRWSYISNDAETFMSVLEMPNDQREEVRTIMQEMDISSNTFGGKSYEKIILAVCSLISDEHLSESIQKYQTSDTNLDKRENTDILQRRLFLSEQFRELMESVGMSSSEHRKIRTRVREMSPYFK
jgi:hypothetical protein